MLALEIIARQRSLLKIEYDAKLLRDIKKRTTLLNHETKLSELEILKAKQLADIEANKFEQMIASIGQKTIVSIANAGPEMQAQMLQSLGLQGFIMTDGNNPINLFNTASGLVGNPQNQGENLF